MLGHHVDRLLLNIDGTVSLRWCDGEETGAGLTALCSLRARHLGVRRSEAALRLRIGRTAFWQRSRTAGTTTASATTRTAAAATSGSASTACRTTAAAGASATRRMRSAGQHRTFRGNAGGSSGDDAAEREIKGPDREGKKSQHRALGAGSRIFRCQRPGQFCGAQFVGVSVLSQLRQQGEAAPFLGGDGGIHERNEEQRRVGDEQHRGVELAQSGQQKQCDGEQKGRALKGEPLVGAALQQGLKEGKVGGVGVVHGLNSQIRKKHLLC